MEKQKDGLVPLGKTSYLKAIWDDLYKSIKKL